MMSDEIFLERLTAVEAMSMGETQLSEHWDSLTALMLDNARDHETLQSEEEPEWIRRRDLLKKLLFEQHAFVARLYRDRIEEGEMQSEGN